MENVPFITPSTENLDFEPSFEIGQKKMNYMKSNAENYGIKDKGIENNS